MTAARLAWGAGFETVDRRGATLDVWYRWCGWGDYGQDAPDDVDVALAGGERPDDVRRVTVRPVRVTVDVNGAPTSAADVYLRLHLLSNRLAAPNTLNLDGIFGLLTNVAWTDLGPVAVADLADVSLARRREGGGPQREGRRQVPVRCSTTCSPRASASPTQRGCASGPTSRTAPR